MLKISGKLSLTAFAVVGLVVFAPGVQAETLYESLQNLVKNQKQIKAAEADLEAAQERAEAAWGDWYPELSVTANWGREKQNKSTGTDDVEEHPREVDVSISSLGVVAGILKNSPGKDRRLGTLQIQRPP